MDGDTGEAAARIAAETRLTSRQKALILEAVRLDMDATRANLTDTGTGTITMRSLTNALGDATGDAQAAAAWWWIF